MLFDHYLWDFDGTLFDSYPHVVGAFGHMMADRGRTFVYEEAMDAFKINFGVAKKNYGCTDEDWKLFRSYERDIDHPPVAPPFAGIPGLLAAIVANGGKNYLYTHRNRLSVTYLERAGLDHLFTGFVTSEDNFPAKPAPDAVLHLVNTFSMDKSRTVMIGDREIDVMAGINAGVSGCLVVGSEGVARDERALAATEAGYRAHFADELYALFAIPR